MKIHNRRFVLTCLLGLLLVGLAGQQSFSQQASSTKTPVAPALNKKEIVASPVEKLVRAAYEKLTTLTKTDLNNLGEESVNASPPEDLYLRFELSNFHIGPIEEILGAVDSKLKTNESGEIIMLSGATHKLNNGPEHVSYKAEWTSGQYSTGYDHQWTIADVFVLEAPRYYDVGQYALYDVSVSFKGKTRAYRALALFHNPYGTVENLKPSFWDSIVGSAGTLTDAWNEKRPLVGQKSNPSIKDGPASAAPKVSPPEMSHARIYGRTGPRYRELP